VTDRGLRARVLLAEAAALGVTIEDLVAAAHGGAGAADCGPDGGRVRGSRGTDVLTEVADPAGLLPRIDLCPEASPRTVS
jgi:hypothetical protein